jgi:hypothetical protein
MKSFTEWKMEDPDWSRLKMVWGSGSKHVDPTLVSKLKLKIQALTNQHIRDLNDPKITTFRDMPPEARDSFAQALVVATLKAFYAEFGSEATGGKASLNTQQLGKFQQTLQPQNDLNAPADWKG